MSEIVAGRLAELRRRRGFSQSALASAARVTRQAVSSIEAGRAQPGVAVALRLAHALGTTVEELFAPPLPEELDAEVASADGGTRRVAAAVVDGRLVARPLNGRDAPLGEPAAALISRAGPAGRARLEPLCEREGVETTVFLSGCEPALGLLAGHLSASGKRGIWFSATNRDALADLTARRTHVAALHGTEAEIRRLVRRIADDVRLFELATIEEGWIVAPDNPARLRGARDLGRPTVRLANRPPGSAARAVLESELRRAGVASASVTGFESALGSHADVARAIAFGYADIGIAVAGVAEPFRLGFIPLRSERCTLAVRASDLAHPGVTALIGTLRSTAFRRDLEAFGPYDAARVGEPLR